MRRIIVLICLFAGLNIQAQDNMQIRGNVVLLNKNNNGERVSIDSPLYLTVMPKSEAYKLKNEINTKLSQYDWEQRDVFFEELRLKHRMQRIRRDGSFILNVIPGLSILIIDIEDEVVKVVDIIEGKTEYKDIEMIVQRIEDVASVGKAAARVSVPILDSESEESMDGITQYHISMRLPAGQVTDKHKITINPYIIDCINGDTINFLRPIHYYGKKYRKQLTEKAQDYYIGSQKPESNKDFVVDTVLNETNPSNYSHRTSLSFMVSVEDNRETISEHHFSGTCLFLNPLKFLQPPVWEPELLPIYFQEPIKRIRKRGEKIEYYIPTPEECVKDYLLHREEYIAGTRYLSNGDVYYLLQNIKDPHEVNTIIQIAYNEMSKSETFEYDWPIAPFICNNIAIQKLRFGAPDRSVLSKFISFDRERMNYKKSNGFNQLITMNQSEMVANQSSVYLYSLEKDTAYYFLGLLEKDSFDINNTYSYINFKKEYMKSKVINNLYLEDVLNICDENKAVLYTELESLGMRGDAMFWVNKMDDDNPIKWYLKAILWAELAGIEEHFDDIPYYLAYLHHCFILDPKFEQYYSFDAQFNDELRREYEYDQEKADEYESLFDKIESFEQ